MDDVRSFAFTPPEFPSQACHGRHMIEAKPKQALFVQGDQADAVFYILSGRTKLTVVSREGKNATITFLSAGDFVGEECLLAAHAIRPTTATAVDDCTVLKISKEEMIRKIHSDPCFADTFVNFLLARNVKTQADLIDQLINSCERRLARVLLLMAEFDRPGERGAFIPPISQETLAEMIGTTRSRVCFLMNRFRKLGFINYSGRIQVYKSRLSAALLDQLPKHRSQRRPIVTIAQDAFHSAVLGSQHAAHAAD
jgi:CRP/FNR family transcriptional regulator, cyclic AMP receptor protein